MCRSHFSTMYHLQPFTVVVPPLALTSIRTSLEGTFTRDASHGHTATPARPVLALPYSVLQSICTPKALAPTMGYSRSERSGEL